MLIPVGNDPLGKKILICPAEGLFLKRNYSVTQIKKIRIIQLVSQYFWRKNNTKVFILAIFTSEWILLKTLLQRNKWEGLLSNLSTTRSRSYICSHWLQVFTVPLMRCWKMATESGSLCPAELYICSSYHWGPDSGSSGNAHVVYIMNVPQSFQKWEPKTKDILETGKQVHHRKTDQM